MRMLFYVLPLCIMIPAGIYLYAIGMRFLSLFPFGGKKWGARVISLLFMGGCLYACWPVYELGAVVVLHFLVFCLVMELVNLLVKKRFSERFQKGWRFCYKTQILSILFIGLLFAYGYVNIHQIQEKEYTISSGKLKEGQSLKIAAFSDLHLGNTMGAEELKEWCEKIEGEEPDMLLLVGDIFDESTEKSQMEQAAEILGQVKSTYGTYYVFGNHDPNLYREEPAYTAKELKSALESQGVSALEDETVLLGEDYALVGRRDASDPERQELSLVTEDLDQNRFTILMDHQPGHLAENEEAGMDLQLSGHTHAGQIWPTGSLMELLGANEINYGYRQVGNLQVIVTSGIAGWGYPIRTGGHSEYLMIQVLPEE